MGILRAGRAGAHFLDVNVLVDVVDLVVIRVHQLGCCGDMLYICRKRVSK